AAGFLFCLAKIEAGGNPRWWLAAGIAAGLGLLAKYSAFFLGLGACVWLLAHPVMRRWLRAPWPWLGRIIAAAIFAPNLWWNDHHGWATFAFQFGRIGAGHFSPRYLVE